MINFLRWFKQDRWVEKGFFSKDWEKKLHLEYLAKLYGKGEKDESLRPPAASS
jgi:hypothetical protein